ncbi:MAG: Gfo/Idh/MocA family oxidoreductase, partial [Hyphomicrobiales bacterium]
AADLQSFVPGRKVDDNGHVMLRFEGGARGMLWCSQVAPGNENNLKVRVYGDRGGLEWHQENPNYLHFTKFGESTRIITRGGAGMSDSVGPMTRIPPGHPEGYLEGFANIYKEAADQIRLHKAGNAGKSLVPGIVDGVNGEMFVDACVRSSERNAAWVKLT